MRLLQPILLSILLILAAPALASVTLRYAADGPGGLGMVIEADDDGNIRAEGSNGQLLMILGDQTYVVLPGQGERLVARIEDAMALAAEARQVVGPRPPPERSTLIERGPQRVGQWEGRLYWIDPLPPLNGRLRSELVIATDPALAPAGRIFARVTDAQVRLFEAAFGGVTSNYTALSRSLFHRGLPLRIVGLYRLESYSAGPVPAARFMLPGPVLSRDAYRERLAQ